ncbi:hypothetical protein Patl1_13300 [Pistacia atlantica]|uniref:Uncharacterized protein n=1 Tax=Pistacia atlantica TaxID=434234 RepID=A0ACC1AUU2_9ROSI|nr:hypothetical protein Patl1_13300 [Pistacia atlantica]
MEKKQQHKVEEKKAGDIAQQVKKRKRKEVFPFGNYKNYYGYRIGEGLDEDPRLKVFKEEWFQGKNCLDIGCNSGIITIQIAKKFQCRTILGVDIDSNRIEDAYWHLRKIVKMEKDERKRAQASRLDVPGNTDGPQRGVTVMSSAEEEEVSKIVLLPLSVTKWIHLNWGDDGLITLFTKIWRLLHPGGIFVLEPQPWRSYEKNRRVSEVMASDQGGWGNNKPLQPIIKILSSIQSSFRKFFWIRLDLEGWKSSLLMAYQTAKLDLTGRYLHLKNDSASRVAASA